MLGKLKNKFLQNRKTDVIEKFKSIGIKIEDYNKIQYNVWIRIFECLIKLYKIYPEIPIGYLSKIDVKRNEINENSIAITGFCECNDGSYDCRHLYISLNKNFFNNINKFYIQKQTTFLDISLNDFIEYTIVHEFGHVIDIYYSVKMLKYAYINLNQCIKFFNEIPFSKIIVSQAINPMIKQMGIVKETLLSEMVSARSSANYQEAFAEAVAFNYFNSNNEIINKVMNVFKEKRGL